MWAGGRSRSASGRAGNPVGTKTLRSCTLPHYAGRTPRPSLPRTWPNVATPHEAAVLDIAMLSCGASMNSEHCARYSSRVRRSEFVCTPCGWFCVCVCVTRGRTTGKACPIFRGLWFGPSNVCAFCLPHRCLRHASARRCRRPRGRECRGRGRRAAEETPEGRRGARRRRQGERPWPRRPWATRSRIGVL